MKRFQLLVLISAVTAVAIWYFFYRSQHPSSVAVASLLPKETLALVHLPDFNRSRGDWHRTDLYQLWMEPTVQDFLAKPRSKVPKAGGVGATIEEIEALQMRDAFVALVSIEYSAWKIVGGFRCKEGAEADKIVANWRGKLLGNASDLKQETIEYQGRRIQTASSGIFNLSTVRAGQWILFANDLMHLKPLLDRVDGREKDAKTALFTDSSFLAVSKHMPSSYAVLAYARVNQIVERLIPAAEQANDSQPDRMASLRHLPNVCAAAAFEGGKIRDTLFVEMPKIADAASLTRASLPLGTQDTFLYTASVLGLTKETELGPVAASMGWLGVFQQITDALSKNGIGAEEWKSAFGAELGVVGDWPTNSQWPAVFFTLPVKDSAKANKIVSAITSTTSDADAWSRQEKEGVHYFSRTPSGQFFSFSPTIGLSKQILIAGMDANSVDAAIKRSVTGNSGLAASKKFQDAERILPEPDLVFAYVDPALVYTRFDATLRPILVMGAAFLPAVADTVDLSKLPPAEVITKHLSPFVISNRYNQDGYEAQSIGPLPLYPTILGAFIAWSGFRGVDQSTKPPRLSPRLSPSPTPSPEDSP